MGAATSSGSMIAIGIRISAILRRLGGGCGFAFQEAFDHKAKDVAAGGQFLQVAIFGQISQCAIQDFPFGPSFEILVRMFAHFLFLCFGP